MMEFLTWLEASAFATWVRESGSLWAYPTILMLHTFGLGILVGANAVVDLRVLGFARGIPLAPLRRLFRIMWVGFAINAVTGTVLFVADASTKITQPVFLVKLVFVVSGVITIGLLEATVYRDSARAHSGIVSTRGKLLASGSLFIWAGAITAGRLMAYL
jgi:hypothetical protein